jgi:hypothetical protein
MRVKIFVVDVQEFSPILAAARGLPGTKVQGPRAGYWSIESDSELVFHRKAMGFKPALWWSMLTGGFEGRIVSYTREELRIAGVDGG